MKKVHALKNKYWYIGYDDKGRQCPISEDWLKENFHDRGHKKWNNKVSSSCEQNFRIPISAPMENKQKEIVLPSHGPKIKHQQGEKLLCLVYSLASALYTIGDHVMQKKVYDSRKDAQKYTNKSNVYFLSNIMMLGASNNKRRIPNIIK